MNLPLPSSGVGKGSKSTQSTLSLFSADANWDPAFVIASRHAVTQQNAYAQHLDLNWARLADAPCSLPRCFYKRNFE